MSRPAFRRMDSLGIALALGETGPYGLKINSRMQRGRVVWAYMPPVVFVQAGLDRISNEPLYFVLTVQIHKLALTKLCEKNCQYLQLVNKITLDSTDRPCMAFIDLAPGPFLHSYHHPFEVLRPGPHQQVIITVQHSKLYLVIEHPQVMLSTPSWHNAHDVVNTSKESQTEVTDHEVASHIPRISQISIY